MAPRREGRDGATVGRGAGAAVVDTALGRCVIAWTCRGVSELHLPDPADGLRRGGDVPVGPPAPLRGGTGPAEPDGGRPPLRPLSNLSRAPAWIRSLARRIQGHFEGRLDGFQDVPLDLPSSASAFDRAVWEAARQVPPGLTITYGELADEAGRPGAARACGSAMRRCPVPLIIPAHRVIAAGRRPGGWTGAGGVPTKLRLLALEGVELLGRR